MVYQRGCWKMEIKRRRQDDRGGAHRLSVLRQLNRLARACRGGPGNDGHAPTRGGDDHLGRAIALLAVQVRELAGAAGGHDGVHATLNHVVGDLGQRRSRPAGHQG